MHYPLDVVAGPLFGMVAAELTSSYIDRIVRREPDEEVPIDGFERQVRCDQKSEQRPLW